MRILLTLITLSYTFQSFAQTGIKGSVKDESGELLPFSTVYIKGTTNGTTANSSADYFLRTPPGKIGRKSSFPAFKLILL